MITVACEIGNSDVYRTIKVLKSYFDTSQTL